MSSSFSIDKQAYPNFARILDTVLGQWPDHLKYLQTNLGERDDQLLDFSEQLATIICRLADAGPQSLQDLAQDYRYLCQQIVLPEELHFRRHGEYRLKSFEDALRTVYQNAPFMTRYMNGLLLSDVVWINHCKCMQHYQKDFLASLPDGADVLEIGPGHGLLLFLATQQHQLGTLNAWDISDASLELAAHTLTTLGNQRPVQLEKRDMFAPDVLSDANAGRFDAIVLSEVLEHLETPQKAIETLHHLCKPGGKVWINVPANSPAPDHLYLVKSLEQVEELVQGCGFEVAQSVAFPTSGTTLEKAIQKELTVNCIVVGRKNG